ncbi:hypothetical protein QE152_g39117 [Popillia japonica]|uniref:Zinc finger PHD-type domain-containing protein n=1 Tax=Popillia japonica TaxID=7064 RepID=A0AAW1HUZ7_POPJA
MAPSKDSSIAFNCKKCTKEVKLYCLCSICNAYYHPSCVLKIPGMYIDEKGKLHCCEDITCEITKYYCVLDEIEKQKRQLEEKNTQIQKLRQELKKQEEACECKQKDIELSQLKQRLFAANNKVLEMSMADYDKQLEQLNDGDDEYTQNIIDNEYEDKLKRLEQRMQQMEKSLENKIYKIQVEIETITNNGGGAIKRTVDNATADKTHTNPVKLTAPTTNTKDTNNREGATQQQSNRQPNKQLSKSDSMKINSISNNTTIPTPKGKRGMINEGNDEEREKKAEKKNIITGTQEDQNSAFTMRKLHWFYTGKYKSDFAKPEMTQHMYKEFGIDDYVIHSFERKTKFSNEAYRYYKIGEPAPYGT